MSLSNADRPAPKSTFQTRFIRLAIRQGRRRHVRREGASLFPAGHLLPLGACIILISAFAAKASDHADPIDPFSRLSLEAGITDLFVFPVLANGEPAFPYNNQNKLSLADTVTNTARTKLSDEQRAQVDSIVVILCVRRALTDDNTLKLQPYTYRVHIDTDSIIEQAQDDPEDHSSADSHDDGGHHHGTADHDHDHDTAAGGAGYAGDATAKGPKRPTPHEAFLRYGGSVKEPEKIQEDITIELRLNNDTTPQNSYPKFLDASGKPLKNWDEKHGLKFRSGVFDDPFIFPAFFGTNIVGMVLKIPVNLIPGDPQDFLIWATSHKGSQQIDHVGRSLRTQNPRFELLNTLHPRDHVAAIKAEHTNPSLLRDIALRFNFAQTFAYRKWDNVPDVMVFSRHYPVGFPNGRLLTDDVAAALAQYGDTLLYELSYQHNKGAWPRQNKNDLNDGKFLADFPYLLDPHQDQPPVDPPALSSASKWKLLGLLVGIFVLFWFENWVVARLYHRWKNRPVYL